jgi:hypothetical protein
MKKSFTGFLIDYSMIGFCCNNPVDFIDGYVLLKNKKGVHRDEDHEFTEKVIRLKG